MDIAKLQVLVDTVFTEDITVPTPGSLGNFVITTLTVPFAIAPTMPILSLPLGTVFLFDWSTTRRFHAKAIVGGVLRTTLSTKVIVKVPPLQSSLFFLDTSSVDLTAAVGPTIAVLTLVDLDCGDIVGTAQADVSGRTPSRPITTTFAFVRKPRKGSKIALTLQSSGTAGSSAYIAYFTLVELKGK
jgi:hypothetical protein